jgi:hypothetical protein
MPVISILFMNNHLSWLKMKKSDVVDVIKNNLILYLLILIKFISIKTHEHVHLVTTDGFIVLPNTVGS